MNKYNHYQFYLEKQVGIFYCTIAPTWLDIKKTSTSQIHYITHYIMYIALKMFVKAFHLKLMSDTLDYRSCITHTEMFKIPADRSKTYKMFLSGGVAYIFIQLYDSGPAISSHS